MSRDSLKAWTWMIPMSIPRPRSYLKGQGHHLKKHDFKSCFTVLSIVEVQVTFCKFKGHLGQVQRSDHMGQGPPKAQDSCS